MRLTSAFHYHLSWNRYPEAAQVCIIMVPYKKLGTSSFSFPENLHTTANELIATRNLLPPRLLEIGLRAGANINLKDCDYLAIYHIVQYIIMKELKNVIMLFPTL